MITVAGRRSASEGYFSSGIPAAVRKHGRALNPTSLEPGDLILVAKRRPGWLSRHIQKAQASLFDEVHSRWHHVAISGGGTEVCEALISGVKPRQYWHYMTGEYDLKIRRVTTATAEERTKAAWFAGTKARTPYGLGSLFSIRKSLNDNDPWKRTIIRSRGVICSQLYFEAWMMVGFLLANLPSHRVCPAHLSASTLMHDVAQDWVTLPT